MAYGPYLDIRKAMTDLCFSIRTQKFSAPDNRGKKVAETQKKVAPVLLDRFTGMIHKCSALLTSLRLHSPRCAMKTVAITMILVCLVGSCFPAETQGREKWAPEQANAWYGKQPWFVGANYTPAYAINQLEMWQAESFDPAV